MSKPYMTLAAMGLTRGMWCLAATLAVGQAVGQAIGEENDPGAFSYHNLMLSVSTAPVPKVKEDSTDGAGTTTHYEWDGMRDTGYRFAVTGLCGKSSGEGRSGWQFGLDLAFATYDITPQSFDVSGATFNNSSTATLHYRTLGVNVVGGWQYGLSTLDDLHAFVEIMPFLGGGVAFASNEVHTVGGYDEQSGTGGYFQYGMRIGGYIVEKRWIFGAVANYTGGRSKVDIDFSGGYSSTLTLTQSGFGLGGVVGYRF
jgi:hypothetical protein